MKPIALSSCLAVAAFSLYAADPQASKDSPTPPLTHVETRFSAQTTAIVDSPLVRAAKSANRFGRKNPSQVITNETLVHEGGHFTVSSPEAQAKKPAGLSAEQIKTEAAAVEQPRKSEEKKKTTTAPTTAPAEGAYNNPPALEAPALEPIKSSAPQTMQQQKPPL